MKTATLDARLPALRIQLFAQAPRAEQRFLFTPSTFVERATEPPCDHPVTQQQRRLLDPNIVDDVCVVCGAVVDDDGEFTP